MGMSVSSILPFSTRGLATLFGNTIENGCTNS